MVVVTQVGEELRTEVNRIIKEDTLIEDDSNINGLEDLLINSLISGEVTIGNVKEVIRYYTNCIIFLTSGAYSIDEKKHRK